MTLEIREHVPLAPYTTLGLGGPARYFLSCTSIDDIREALSFARQRSLPVFVLGGGSNLVVSDRGFDGVVLHPLLLGTSFRHSDTGALFTAAAGEVWDDVVRAAVDRGLAGLECLSGIPGTVGATPIQNVGAYGQEVRETIHSVDVFDRELMHSAAFAGGECDFGYRLSRFKGKDAGRYIITAVHFLLRADGIPTLRYPELQRAVSERLGRPSTGPASLRTVRETVLALRRSKSMLVDPADPESRSAGSFFLNPVLDGPGYAAFLDSARGHAAEPPVYPGPGGTKVPAAWLVEHAGFPRGTRRGGVGISRHHALALVNYDGSTSEILALAADIRAAVKRKFGIVLDMEPIILEGSHA